MIIDIVDTHDWSLDSFIHHQEISKRIFMFLWLDLTGVIADLNFPFPAGSGVTFGGHVCSHQRDSRYAHPGSQPLSALENKTASCGSPFSPAHLLRQSWTQSHNTVLTPPNTPSSPGINTPLRSSAEWPNALSSHSVTHISQLGYSN